MQVSAQEESSRTQALEQYEALQAVADPAMAEITALAAETCGTSMAGISLLGPDALHIQARVGPGPARIPLGNPICESCIHSGSVYEILEAIVLAGQPLNFYAGAPLTTSSGVHIGCLFVQDVLPHSLSEKQRRALVTLAHQIINRFELKARIRSMERESKLAFAEQTRPFASGELFEANLRALIQRPNPLPEPKADPTGPTPIPRSLDQMKDEFISTVSHELRTPLTSLRAALGLVTGGALATRPEKMQQMLEIAIGSTDRLIHLVNNILDLERIDSGTTAIQPGSCPARELLARAVEIQQASTTSNLQFRIQAEDVTVWADRDQIVQVLVNIVANAAKYSPPGGEILLTARLLSAAEAEIVIHDQGPGVPPNKLESIFERFQQADASDTRVLGGTGLGLAICRSIVNQHEGRIWASTSQDRGASFHITLPTRPTPTPPLTSPST